MDKFKRAPLKNGLIMLVSITVIYHLLSLGINKPISDNIQVIAHTGGAAYAPPNTITAFENAIQDNVDWLEFDVQLSSDGVPIVFHDEIVLDLGGGNVSDYSLSELQQIDFGEGQTIPTFEAILQLAKDNDYPIFPEAKSPDLNSGLEEKMVSLIVGYEYQNLTIIQSFSAKSLEEIHDLNPDISLCYLYGLANLTWHLRPPYPGDAEYLCVLSEMILLFPGMVRQAHTAGREVFVYPGVITQSWAIRWAIALGVDGVILDDYRIMDKILSP